jgi:hypothetical protein
MTLSTLAYVDENTTATQQQMISEINAGLKEAGYKEWQVIWGPALNVDRSNLAYVARNSVTGQLAVSSIYSRGKYISIALIELLTFWLRSAATGMGDRCRCGGFVEVGIG